MDKKLKRIEEAAKNRAQSGGSDVLGYEMRKDPYAIIMEVGRKKSGKSTATEMILDVCLPKKIPVIIICPTIDTDTTWRRIIDWLKKRGNPVFEYYGLMDPDTGENNLQAIMKHMEKLNRKDPNHLKAKGLKYMLIMDDCGKQMRHPSVYQFACKNRHDKCGMILSGQSMKNIQPDVRQQIGLWLLFPKLNEKDLKTIYEDSDPPVSWEEFEAAYDKATAEPYSFLYFTPDGEFRVKFEDPNKEKKKDEKTTVKHVDHVAIALNAFLRSVGIKTLEQYRKLSSATKVRVQKALNAMKNMLEGKA